MASLTEDSSSWRHHRREDSSSKRRRREDDSPPRRRRREEDSLPRWPRRRREDDSSSSRRRRREEDSSPRRRLRIRSREYTSSRRRKRARGIDRLGGLPDNLLGHILSFLPTTAEAGRAAVLSRRWRYVFGHVHTVSFEEDEGERAADWHSYYYEAKHRKSCSYKLLDTINAALLCRRRCAGQHVPLRRFHFTFDSYHWWDGVAVNQWLSHVLQCNRTQELHLDLQFHHIDWICSYYDKSGRWKDDDAGSDSDDEQRRLDPWTYVLPTRIFSCVGLRTLRLSGCRMKLPEKIDLPCLETLHLTRIKNSGRSIQRLISSCPRLADVTLQALGKLRKLSVLDKRLRRFALQCCHNVESVAIDVSELKAVVYSGPVQLESIMPMDELLGISSCTINFCKFRQQKRTHTTAVG